MLHLVDVGPLRLMMNLYCILIFFRFYGFYLISEAQEVLQVNLVRKAFPEISNYKYQYIGSLKHTYELLWSKDYLNRIWKILIFWTLCKISYLFLASLRMKASFFIKVSIILQEFNIKLIVQHWRNTKEKLLSQHFETYFCHQPDKNFQNWH